ncbi:MAG: carboxypeptidase regulatory-like domain-containing protein [Cyanobacteria bacterium P01_A01_bin.135]
MRRLAILLLGAIAAASSPTAAIAHGVDLTVEPTQALRVQARYDSGQPMEDAAVAVYSPDNPAEPWLTGTTDDNGYFTFTPGDAAGDWAVQVRQAGHGEMVTVPVTASGRTETQLLTQSANLLSPLQKGLMIGAVFWGCIGTALFFSARRPPQGL